MPSKEAEELGPEPRGTEADLWREERWGAVGLLAGLADDNVELVRQAAKETAAEWTGREAARLRGCGRQSGDCGYPVNAAMTGQPPVLGSLMVT